MTTQPDLKALDKFINDNRDKGFQWHTNDCFMFTNRAWEVMYGHGWADDWSNKYITDNGMYMSFKELQEEFGFSTLEEAIDSKLTRVEGVPPRGALVLTNYSEKFALRKSFGISVGNKCVFLGKRYLTFLPTKYITEAWVE